MPFAIRSNFEKMFVGRICPSARTFSSRAPYTRKERGVQTGKAAIDRSFITCKKGPDPLSQLSQPSTSNVCVPDKFIPPTCAMPSTVVSFQNRAGNHVTLVFRH